jgi:hypothetical protein
MSTPAKIPKPKPNAAANAVLLLLAQNLNEMARWHRRSSHPGHEVGHILMKEFVYADLGHALVLAIEGKSWVPPRE